MLWHAVYVDPSFCTHLCFVFFLCLFVLTNFAFIQQVFEITNTTAAHDRRLHKIGDTVHDQGRQIQAIDVALRESVGPSIIEQGRQLVGVGDAVKELAHTTAGHGRQITEHGHRITNAEQGLSTVEKRQQDFETWARTEVCLPTLPCSARPLL